MPAARHGSAPPLEQNASACYTVCMALQKHILPAFVFIAVALLYSCVGTRVEPPPVSRSIAGSGTKSAPQLAAFFLSRNPEHDKAHITEFAAIYIEEAAAEGINSDVAFVQMCHETGFLRFGNLVSADMHNYCGLGAIDAEHRGEVFATEREGVRAHIQHLHAYGTTGGLRNPLIDNRYKWVSPRGKAQDIFALTGTWAADPQYGQKLDSLLCELEQF